MTQWNITGIALTIPLGVDSKINFGCCLLDQCPVLLEHTNLHLSAVFIFYLNSCCDPAEMFM